MQKLQALFLAAILLPSIVLINFDFTPAYSEKPEKYSPDTLIVKFKDGVSQAQKQSVLDQNGAKVSADIHQIDVQVLSLPQNSLERVELALQNNPNIEYVERDWLLEPTTLSNDPWLPNQWHLSKVNATTAWDDTKGNGTSIAILDSGIDLTHPDLSSKIVNPWNFYSDNGDVSDKCGHGTSVAGTAAAITNNNLGVAGVSWNSTIIPIKITDPLCYGYTSAMIQGIVYAADMGAKSANISYRLYNGYSVEDAAKYMFSKGGWVVVSGGNTGEYRSISDNLYVISVSATDSTDSVTSWSTSGPYIDFAAPGQSILTTTNGGNYGYVSGTSFSAPITAAAVALVSAADPTLTAEQIYNKLRDSAVDLGAEGRDASYGWGRIDIASAIHTPAKQIEDPIPVIDTIPPEVSILNPEHGTTVSGKTSISISALDNIGLTKVELFVNGQHIVSFDSSFDYEWNPKGASGNQIISGVATDLEGNTNEHSIEIFVEKGGGDKTSPGKGNGKGNNK